MDTGIHIYTRMCECVYVCARLCGKGKNAVAWQIVHEHVEEDLFCFKKCRTSQSDVFQVTIPLLNETIKKCILKCNHSAKHLNKGRCTLVFSKKTIFVRVSIFLTQRYKLD